jgi:hypothetical protein
MMPEGSLFRNFRPGQFASTARNIPRSLTERNAHSIPNDPLFPLIICRLPFPHLPGEPICGTEAVLGRAEEVPIGRNGGRGDAGQIEGGRGQGKGAERIGIQENDGQFGAGMYKKWHLSAQSLLSK